jgi:hypothetical protein
MFVEPPIGRNPRGKNGGGIVTHVRLAVRLASSSRRTAANQLRRTPIPAGDQSTGDLARSSVRFELLRCGEAERGIPVSNETVQCRVSRCQPTIAADLRKHCPRLGKIRHLNADLKIFGRMVFQ